MTNNLFDLSGRVALVSGAAAGMGRAMAIGLAEAGADLMLADMNGDGLYATTETIERIGHRVIPVVGDITDLEHTRSVFERLDREYGRLDIVCNVAGYGATGKPEEVPIEIIQLNLHRLVVTRFLWCQEAGKRMLPARRGSIINMCSTAGLRALGRNHLPYSIAMAAVTQMTRELSTEWSGRGVRVNAIVCAQVRNPELEERMRQDPSLEGRFLSGIPIGRLGVPDDIKGVTVFLASDASAWVTGVLLPLDGGNQAMNAGGTIPSSL
jgi:NAD(P)-dependent dehydrogenase (short-subunit alcohol dehydrogenase family)